MLCFGKFLANNFLIVSDPEAASRGRGRGRSDTEFKVGGARKKIQAIREKRRQEDIATALAMKKEMASKREEKSWLRKTAFILKQTIIIKFIFGKRQVVTWKIFNFSKKDVGKKNALKFLKFEKEKHPENLLIANCFAMKQELMQYFDNTFHTARLQN